MDRRHHGREDEERPQRFEPLEVTFLDRKTGMECDTAVTSSNQQHKKETHESEIQTSSAGNDFSRVFTVTAKQQEHSPSYGRYHESQQTPAQGRYWSEQIQQWPGHTQDLSGPSPQWSAQDQQWPGQNQWPMTTSSNVTVTQPSVTNNVAIASRRKPDNHLCMSVFVLICCFWPVGIYTVIQSTQVNNLYAQGKLDAARQTSRSVRNLNVGAMVFGFIFLFITATLVFFMFKNSHLI